MALRGLWDAVVYPTEYNNLFCLNIYNYILSFF